MRDRHPPDRIFDREGEVYATNSGNDWDGLEEEIIPGRRLPIRWEKKTENYKSLTHFAGACITYRSTHILG